MKYGQKHHSYLSTFIIFREILNIISLFIRIVLNFIIIVKTNNIHYYGNKNSEKLTFISPTLLII